jgi:hypothetical protein
MVIVYFGINKACNFFQHKLTVQLEKRERQRDIETERQKDKGTVRQTEKHIFFLFNNSA